VASPPPNTILGEFGPIPPTLPVVVVVVVVVEESVDVVGVGVVESFAPLFVDVTAPDATPPLS